MAATTATAIATAIIKMNRLTEREFSIIHCLALLFDTQPLFLPLITAPRGATLTLAAGASIGARVLLSLHAPENAAGEFIIDRALVIHFLTAQVMARTLRGD